MARRSRVKSGVFYLRNKLDTNAASFAQATVDISSFVNVLEGEVLRIKQVWFEWTSDDYLPIAGTDVGASGAAKGASCAAQLTSDSKSAIHSFDQVGVIAKNNIYAHIGAVADLDMVQQSTGLNPYDFEDGYFVATDNIFLGVKGSTVDTFSNDLTCQVLMECEIVKLSLADAQAVLVSQTNG
jgi:hypothetical protein